MDSPDIITIEVAQKAKVEANRAHMFVSVAGASLLSGAMALQKAREVAELVATLRTIDIAESQVKVETVRAQTQSGTFSKSSSVIYALRIENVPLERIADAIGAITSAKNATLDLIEWHFADETPLRDDLRDQCLKTAIKRAQSVAQTLGVRLLGVHKLNEDWRGTQDETVPPRRVRQQSLGLLNAKVSEPELGMAISHADQVSLKLTIQFRVSEFEN
ncbi:MAG TPA: SIMPL domain-containing protein [Abditibacterium sp.]|jgi:uncharacterized protein YggE